MSAISMPGFTAAASIYRSKTNYRVAGAQAALPGVGELVPQLAIFDPIGGGACHVTSLDGTVHTGTYSLWNGYWWCCEPGGGCWNCGEDYRLRCSNARAYLGVTEHPMMALGYSY